LITKILNTKKGLPEGSPFPVRMLLKLSASLTASYLLLPVMLQNHNI